MRAVALLIGVGLACLGPRAARADEPADDAMVAGARERFREGMRAAGEGRWEDAHAAFAEVYAAVRRPRILVNLATAQAHTGRLAEAARSYRQFLAEAQPGAESAAMRAQVERELRSVEARVGRLEIVPAGEGPDDRVLIDGRELSPEELAGPLEVNPGAHTITIARGSATLATLEASAEAGSTTRVMPVVVSTSTVVAPEAHGAPPLERSPAEVGGRAWWEAPWLWGTAGVVVAAGAAVAIWFALDEGPPLREGNFGTGRWAVE